jgi:hypothetical protein
LYVGSTLFFFFSFLIFIFVPSPFFVTRDGVVWCFVLGSHHAMTGDGGFGRAPSYLWMLFSGMTCKTCNEDGEGYKRNKRVVMQAERLTADGAVVLVVMVSLYTVAGR